MKLQRYVSSELTHFVGRTAKDDEERYEILADRILKTGRLIAPGYSSSEDSTDEQGRLRRTIKVTGTARDVKKQLSGNDKYAHAAICFCDIPLADLPIHIAKYSPFGLSFPKAFLVKRGASPIFYVERNAASRVRRTELISPNGPFPESWPPGYEALPLSLAEAFDYADAGYSDLSSMLHDLRYSGGAVFLDPERERRRIMHSVRHYNWKTVWESVIDNQLLPFLKFFDSSLGDEHELNFYMEREWRAIGVIHFSPEDVERILMPRAYSRRFRREFPDYCGQLTFTD